MENQYKVALLATGDEISNGDILNTNAQEIARKLFDHSIHVGMHVVTSDRIMDIEQAILFLLQSHQALIITGGLGPTSDDLTRFALSQVVNQPLVFHTECWDIIADRLKRLGYDAPPESNRQQALFPAEAMIIPNPNGTAAGCLILHNDRLVFMLPGPPTECLPMLHSAVLPKLKELGFPKNEYHQKWLLFGVSEGQIAETLDELAKPYDCITGYRLCYPYIEFKIHCKDAEVFKTLTSLVETAIHSHLIRDGKKTASELLRHHLETIDFNLGICDRATGGLLETTLKTPKNQQHLDFHSSNENFKAPATYIDISGLKAFWHEKNTTQATLDMTFHMLGKNTDISTTIPFRGQRVKQYAVEFICWKILDFLNA